MDHSWNMRLQTLRVGDIYLLIPVKAPLLIEGGTWRDALLLDGRVAAATIETDDQEAVPDHAADITTDPEAHHGAAVTAVRAAGDDHIVDILEVEHEADPQDAETEGPDRVHAPDQGLEAGSASPSSRKLRETNSSWKDILSITLTDIHANLQRRRTFRSRSWTCTLCLKT